MEELNMLKRELLRKFVEMTGIDEEVTHSELMGMAAFTGIPADLCETVAEHVEIFNLYRSRGWEADKAAVLTLAESEGFYLEDILKVIDSADEMRRVLSLYELGVRLHGKSLPCNQPELSETLLEPFKRWAESLVKIGFSKTIGDFDPEFNPDNWKATMFYAINHRSEINSKIEQYKRK